MLDRIENRNLVQTSRGINQLSERLPTLAIAVSINDGPVTLNFGEYWTESGENCFENVNNFPPATICGPQKRQRRSLWQMLLAGLTNMSRRESTQGTTMKYVFSQAAEARKCLNHLKTLVFEGCHREAARHFYHVGDSEKSKYTRGGLPHIL